MTPPANHSPRLRRWAAVVVVGGLALGGVAAGAAPASAAAPGGPIPDGVYRQDPDLVIKNGAVLELDIVGSACSVLTSAAFVDADGAFPVAIGKRNSNAGPWDQQPIWLETPAGAKLPIGDQTVTGHLAIGCTDASGGSATTENIPLRVSPTPPKTIYHVSSQSSIFTTGAVTSGAPVTIEYLGFQPRESVTVALFDLDAFFKPGGDGSWSGLPISKQTVTADGEGAITATLPIPSDFVANDTLEIAAGGAASHYLPWTSTQPTPLESGDASRVMTVTPRGIPGSPVTVSAGGFTPGDTITIALHSAASPAMKLGSLIADGSGRIAGTLHLPVTAPTGSDRIWAGAQKVGYQLLNAPITVAPGPAVDRTAGADRYDTSVRVSASFSPFSSGTGTVYLASGNAFPDALGAGALAAEAHCPVLLTAATQLPAEVASELVRLHPARVKIVGGTNAVSDDVLRAVKDLDFTHTTTRIGGTDRYATNRLLVSDALSHAATVYLATGAGFPDALAAGPAAAHAGGAVVLIDGAAPALDGPTLRLLASLGPSHIHLVGGTAAISASVENQLRGLYPGAVVRDAGADRFATAARLVAGSWSSASHVVLASGVNFPDALGASALGLPMLTSMPTCIPDATLTELGALDPSRMTIVGGTGAMSEAVARYAHC